MTETGFTPDWFSSPGSTIANLMRRRGADIGTLAHELSRDCLYIERLLVGTESIDHETAKGLAKHLGGSLAFWLARQRRYDESLRRSAESLSASEAKAWLASIPINDLKKAGWLNYSSRSEALIAAMSFFSVASRSEWSKHCASFAASFSYRHSPTFESKIGALAAWLRLAEVQASTIKCRPWQPQAFSDALKQIKPLTMLRNPKTFVGKLRAICSDAGVAVVFVKAPPGCRASGATRFVSPQKAVMVLSFRHLSDDHFWFSFFHEAGHIVLHGPDSTFVDGDDTETTEKEREANAFAANALIPPTKFEALAATRHRFKDIVRFSVSLGVSPGIVVGQMQHHGLIKPSQFNNLKRRYTWDEVQLALSR